jgi:peptide-methionine (S)-S-oxide reductase
MRQGNDRGTQYRSAVYATGPEQADAARRAIAEYQPRLSASGYGPITTEVVPAGPFHFAERYHQQYLDKNPNGYCPIHATGVTCG